MTAGGLPPGLGKNVRSVLDEAMAAGWTLRRVTSGGHLQMVHPESPSPVIVAPKDGDPRGIRNARAQLRRMTVQEQGQEPEQVVPATEHECVMCAASFPTAKQLRGHMGGKHSGSLQAKRRKAAVEQPPGDDADEIIDELVQGMVIALRAAIEAAVASERSRADRLAGELAQVKGNLATIAEMLRDV